MRKSKKIRIALDWAKDNLPPEQYNEIRKSYDKTSIRTIIFVICCIPIMCAFLSLIFFAPFSNKADEDATPKGATMTKTARVDYDNNFYWTHDSQKYECALEDYGLNPNNYNPTDQLTVYLDDNQNVLKVTDIEEGLSVRDIEILVGSIGSIVVPVLLITCVYIPIAYSTFGKPWRKFIREYYRR